MNEHHKKICVCMDQASVQVMEFTNTIITHIVMSDSTYEEKEKTLQNDGIMRHNKEQQL